MTGYIKSLSGKCLLGNRQGCYLTAVLIFAIKVCNENRAKLTKCDEKGIQRTIESMSVSTDIMSNRMQRKAGVEKNENTTISIGFLNSLSLCGYDECGGGTPASHKKYFEKVGYFKIDLKVLKNKKGKAVFFPYLEIISASTDTLGLFFGKVNTTFSKIKDSAIKIIHNYQDKNGTGLLDANCHRFVSDMIKKELNIKANSQEYDSYIEPGLKGSHAMKSAPISEIIKECSFVTDIIPCREAVTELVERQNRHHKHMIEHRIWLHKQEKEWELMHDLMQFYRSLNHDAFSYNAALSDKSTLEKKYYNFRVKDIYGDKNNYKWRRREWHTSCEEKWTHILAWEYGDVVCTREDYVDGLLHFRIWAKFFVEDRGPIHN